MLLFLSLYFYFIRFSRFAFFLSPVCFTHVHTQRSRYCVDLCVFVGAAAMQLIFCDDDNNHERWRRGMDTHNVCVWTERYIGGAIKLFFPSGLCVFVIVLSWRSHNTDTIITCLSVYCCWHVRRTYCILMHISTHENYYIKIERYHSLVASAAEKSFTRTYVCLFGDDRTYIIFEVYAPS